MKVIEIQTVKDFFEVLVDQNDYDDDKILWFEVLSNCIGISIGESFKDSDDLDTLYGSFSNGGGYFELSADNNWTLPFTIKSNDLIVGKVYKMKFSSNRNSIDKDIIEL